MKPGGTSLLRYALLPGIGPRVARLVGPGFPSVGLYMALTLRAVGLLPPGHPALHPDAARGFGIFGLLAAAADRLTLSWRHADQILMFVCILAGLALLVTQFALLAFALVAWTAPAAAQAVPFAAYFTIPDPAQKLDYIALDRVFGVPGIFDSCVSTGVTCLDGRGQPIPGTGGATIPWPIHTALHTLFAVYNGALAMVAAIVVLYFAVAATVESAVTGTPFGQRFSHAWVLPRLVMFAALMLPTATGLNLGQVGVLHVAKYGGALATNGWSGFNTVLTGTYLGQANAMLATPNAPEMGYLVQFMFTARACQMIEQGRNHAFWSDKIDGFDGVKAYLVRDVLSAGENYALASDMTYEQALAFADGKGPIIIRFGARSVDVWPDEKGFVGPLCGEIRIEPQDLSVDPAQSVYGRYYDMVKAMWGDAGMAAPAGCLLNKTLHNAPDPDCADILDGDTARDLVETYQAQLQAILQTIRTESIAGLDLTQTPDALYEKGWAGAYIWFDRIARLNGAVATALLHIPTPTRMPLIMEMVREGRQEGAASAIAGPLGSAYNPHLGDGLGTVDLSAYPPGRGLEAAVALNAAYTLFDASGATHINRPHDTGNQFLDIINFLLGTDGLFDIRQNASAHPLAQLTALGRGIVERSIQHLLMAAGSYLGESALKLLLPGGVGAYFGNLAGAGTQFFITFGMIGLIIGFILAYVMPFMPAMYFIFAVSGWIKAIFEAIVAVPLWALAHLRVDGEGLPGRDASAGYMLLLGIFLRPILIVFGLLASILIFTATILVFHDVYDLVIVNMAGHPPLEHDPDLKDMEFYRGPVDQFFYTALYTIVVYMTGTSCFKMIDEVPNQIMRWIGFQVQTFQEGVGDPAGELQQRIYGGSLLFSQQADSLSGRLAVAASYSAMRN